MVMHGYALHVNCNALHINDDAQQDNCDALLIYGNAQQCTTHRWQCMVMHYTLTAMHYSLRTTASTAEGAHENDHCTTHLGQEQVIIAAMPDSTTL
eukprot:2895187-Rhodomonas_salina.1